MTTPAQLITADQAHASLPVDRSDFPDLDPVLQVNLLWSPSTRIAREESPAVPEEIQALIGEVETAGKLLE